MHWSVRILTASWSFLLKVHLEWRRRKKATHKTVFVCIFLFNLLVWAMKMFMSLQNISFCCDLVRAPYQCLYILYYRRWYHEFVFCHDIQDKWKKKSFNSLVLITCFRFVIPCETFIQFYKHFEYLFALDNIFYTVNMSRVSRREQTFSRQYQCVLIILRV